MTKKAILAFADGTVLTGQLLGHAGTVLGEVVFNTAMTGYQEILTDPSYAEQIITFTYPHIGNTGINAEDNESQSVHAKGLIIRHLSPITSSWRATMSLDDWLRQNKVTGIAEVDSRQITRRLAQHGFMNACISSELDAEAVVDRARSFPGMQGLDLTGQVSTREIYQLGQNHSGPHLVAYDFGIKQAIIDKLLALECRVSVVPANTAVVDALKLAPDALLLSNGPGDPAASHEAIALTKAVLKTGLPVLGICLGCQLLGLAMGAETYKMKFGHHGANQPVRDERSRQVAITSQNHGFAIADKALPENLIVTHRSLFDGSIQGIRHKQLPVFGFQGHPEANPGPQDIAAIFKDFIELVQERSSRVIDH